MVKPLIAVLLMAGVTYLPRVLPLALFKRNIQSPFVRTFLRFMPFSVLASLTFPDILYSTTSAASAVAGTLAAVILAFFRRSLVSVALGAIIIVFAVESMFLL